MSVPTRIDQSTGTAGVDIPEVDLSQWAELKRGAEVALIPDLF